MHAVAIIKCFLRELALTTELLSGQTERKRGLLVADNFICSPIVLFLHYSHLEIIRMFLPIHTSEADEGFQKQVKTFSTSNLPKRG